MQVHPTRYVRAAVTPHVDHDVFLEALAIFHRNVGGVHAGFGVVAVYVQDWRRNDLGDVEQYGPERECVGFVVNPIWLLTTR